MPRTGRAGCSMVLVMTLRNRAGMMFNKRLSVSRRLKASYGSPADELSGELQVRNGTRRMSLGGPVVAVAPRPTRQRR